MQPPNTRRKKAANTATIGFPELGGQAQLDPPNKRQRLTNVNNEDDKENTDPATNTPVDANSTGNSPAHHDVPKEATMDDDSSVQSGLSSTSESGSSSRSRRDAINKEKETRAMVVDMMGGKLGGINHEKCKNSIRTCIKFDIFPHVKFPNFKDKTGAFALQQIQKALRMPHKQFLAHWNGKNGLKEVFSAQLRAIRSKLTTNFKKDYYGEQMIAATDVPFQHLLQPNA